MKNTFKLLKIVSFTFLILFFASCDDDSTTAPTRNSDDVRLDFQNLTINPGINDLTLESAYAGSFWNFRIIAPEGASPTNKKPLIFRLHGGATNISSTVHQTTSCLVEPGFEDIDAFIVSPNSNGSLWYQDLNIVQILALVELCTTYLDVDTDKVAVMGYSDGGNGAWFFSQYYPTLFTAAIPMATSPIPSSQSGIAVYQFEIPIYAIHGSDDELFPIATTQEYVNESIAAGSDITFVTADGLSHLNSCDYVPYLQDAADWLVNTVWD